MCRLTLTTDAQPAAERCIRLCRRLPSEAESDAITAFEKECVVGPSLLLNYHLGQKLVAVTRLPRTRGAITNPDNTATPIVVL
jgi:hypothetical protein